MRETTLQIGMLALSVLAALLAMEGLLRLTTGSDFGSAAPLCGNEFFGGDVLVFDPVLGWRNRVGPMRRECEGRASRVGEDAPINSLGFRGPEITRKKSPGVIRVACLGDSGTFGILATRDPEHPKQREWRAIPSYPAALADRLASAGFSNTEVINAGVIGYSTSHGLRLLILRILELEPDIVTVRFGSNDAMQSWAPQRRAIEPRNAIARSGLYALADWRLTRLALRAYQVVPHFHPKPLSVPWTSESRFRTNLVRMAAVTQQRGARLLLIDYPVGPQGRLGITEVGKRLPALQRSLREFSKQSGVPLLETNRTLLPPAGRNFDPADAIHPNERGAERLGELLFEKLQSLGWLGQAPEAAGR